MELELAADKEITRATRRRASSSSSTRSSGSVQNRATDIHFEPQEDELRIRNRIDGILHLIPLAGAVETIQAAIHLRIKVMSGMKHSEKRLPQDGSHQRPYQGRGN